MTLYGKSAKLHEVIYVEAQCSFGGGTRTVRSQISLLELQLPEPHVLPLGLVLSLASQVLWAPWAGALGFRLSEGSRVATGLWQRMVRASPLPGEAELREVCSVSACARQTAAFPQEALQGCCGEWGAEGPQSTPDHITQEGGDPSTSAGRRGAEEDASFDIPWGSLPCWQCLWPNSGL